MPTMKQPLEISNNIEVDLVKDVADVVTSKIVSCQNEESESFFVCDLGDVVQKYKLWSELLPRVKPVYDVRCNSDAAVLSVLSQLDVGFNCSSKGDVKVVLDRGIHAFRLTYSSPCKLTSHIKYAANHGVQSIMFESETELHKIKSFHPNAKLLLRLLPLDVKTSSQSMNFGCHVNDVSDLLCVAKRLDLNVIGISIQTTDISVDNNNITRTVAFAHLIFALAKREGFSMTLLDVGESIRKSSSTDVSLRESCCLLQTALDNYFPAGCGIAVTAEAGRFFVESAFTLVTRVVDKTVVIADDLDGMHMTANDDASVDLSGTTPDIIYYLGDGIFRSFSGILYDGLAVKPALIDPERFSGFPQHASRLLGPSGDSLDCIVRCCRLPELFVGDWVLFHDMGAYALSGSVIGLDDDETTRPNCHYTMHAKDWIHLCCCSSVADVGPLTVLAADVDEPSIEWLDI